MSTILRRVTMNATVLGHLPSVKYIRSYTPVDTPILTLTVTLTLTNPNPYPNPNPNPKDPE